MPFQTFLPFAVMGGALVVMAKGREAVWRYTGEWEPKVEKSLRQWHEHSVSWEMKVGGPTPTKFDPYIPGVQYSKFYSPSKKS